MAKQIKLTLDTADRLEAYKSVMRNCAKGKRKHPRPYTDLALYVFKRNYQAQNLGEIGVGTKLSWPELDYQMPKGKYAGRAEWMEDISLEDKVNALEAAIEICKFN